MTLYIDYLCMSISNLIKQKIILYIHLNTIDFIINYRYKAYNFYKRIAYANTAIDDKSDIAELMQYFKKSVGEHQNFQKLCNRVKYFKETRKGVSDMCRLVEDYAAEKIKQADIQTATNLIKNGVSVDIIAKSIPSLTYEFIAELSRKLLQSSSF